MKFVATADWHIGKNIFDMSSINALNSDGEIEFLIIAGDITHFGKDDEIKQAAEILERINIPIYYILGNHDLDLGSYEKFNDAFAGIKNIKLISERFELISKDGLNLGITGLKGFIGGYSPNKISGRGEVSIRKMLETKDDECSKLENNLNGLKKMNADVIIAVIHYAPFNENLGDEHKELYPMLGCSDFGDIFLKNSVNLVLHGHAHEGKRGLFRTGINTKFANVGAKVNDNFLCIYDISKSGSDIKISASKSKYEIDLRKNILYYSAY